MSPLNHVKRELAGRRLVFNIIWWSVHWGLFAYGWWAQATNARLAGLNTLKFSVVSGRTNCLDEIS